MAKLKWTPQEFIATSFSPMIAVATTSAVENICRRNSLTFIELLAPFCKLSGEAQLKDPSGGVSSIKNLRIQLVDINARPPHPTLARKFLNTSVSIPTENVRTTPVSYENHKIDIPSTIPWFDSWRETFLQVQFPSDHEFTRHFLSCIFVISSSEQNPLESLNGLLQHMTTLQSCTNAEVPKWFNSNIYKYFVLVHDTLEGNNDVAIQTFESLKQTYGPSNCHFLPTNSRPPDENPLYLPDPWAQFLNRRGTMGLAGSTSSSARSSPKSPTESGSVGSMPSISSQGENTPPLGRGRLEVGQEANEANSTIQYHPLSPENETRTVPEEESDNLTPLNSNVWRGSPSVSFSQGIHGCCLTMNDIEALKVLIHDFLVRGLIPYVEKQIQVIQEIISNKKGVSRSLFSATKRWFTPSKPGSSTAATAFNSVVYATDSTEIQLRRLGDLYFMFGNYNMAFQAYHTVKRDFMADQAWLYYSGALEMAGLASFMGGEMNRKSMEYLEESITTYLNICRRPHLATRATLFSTECLKYRKMYGEAANQFIRMTSEESDLRSALLLEQAAYCFLNCVKPKMLRKYAFHIVLSGHRYSKCSQKKHSLRCYRQAYQVYNDKSWSLAEDHIHFTIGRMASSLQLLDEATNSFSQLITALSRQTAQQQAIFLKEYLVAHQNLLKEKTANQNSAPSLPMLPIPLIEQDEIKVLLGPQQPLRTPGRVAASGISFVSNFSDPIHGQWNKLEEMIVQELSATPIVFKPQVTFFTSKTITQTKPIAIIGEPIQVAVGLKNILQISLPIKDIYLLWSFKGKNNGNDFIISNETSNLQATDPFIRTHILKSICITANCTEEVILNITPLSIGELVIEGVGYTLVNTIPTDSIGHHCVPGKQLFKIKGQRLKTKEKEGQPQYAPDRKLEVIIAPSAPCLQASFSEINSELLGNEIQNISIELRNCGSTALTRIIMASTVPELFSLSNLCPPRKESSDKLKCRAYAIPIHLPSSYNDKLEPGQSYMLSLWMRAPNKKGTTSLDLMFYYENVDANSVPRYRVVRHQWHVAIQDSLEVEMNCQPSYGRNMVETLAMCITVMNSNQVHHAVISEMILEHTSLISKNWNLHNKNLHRRDIKLQSQEKVHIFLKIFRLISPADVPNHSKIAFIDPVEPVNQEIEYACLDFGRRGFAPEPQPFAAPVTQTDDNPLLEALLIIGWHATITDSTGNKRKAFGQHQYCIKHLSAIFAMNKENLPFLNQKRESIQRVLPRDSVANLSVLQKQVTYNMIHPSELTHDFSTGFVCIAPVLIVINSTVPTPLIVKLNTLGTSNENPIAPNRFELANPQSLSSFRWIGQSEFIAQVPPYTSVKLSLKCAFIAPGTYDLGGRIEILCRQPDTPYSAIMQNATYDSSIVVKSVK